MPSLTIGQLIDPFVASQLFDEQDKPVLGWLTLLGLKPTVLFLLFRSDFRFSTTPGEFHSGDLLIIACDKFKSGVVFFHEK